MLRLDASGLRLFVDYEVGAGEPARALRQAFDRDQNGALDAGEQQALLEHLARTATLRTELRVDGARLLLHRASVRPEKLDEAASSTALLAVRVELSATWPPKNKKNFFFEQFLSSAREVGLADEDTSGHVPVTVECDGCRIAEASSGVPEKNFVRGGNTPLTLSVKF